MTEPPPRRRRTGLIAGIVAGGVVVAALAVAAGLAVGGQSLRTAAVGDCLHYDTGDQTPQRRDCNAEDANFKVLGVTEGLRDCVEVLGTTRTLEVNDKVLCIAESDVDPSKAVNGAQVGDCLTVRGDDAEKSVCGAGSQPVLKVLKNQLRSTGGGADLAYLCQDVDDAEQVYGWTLESVPPSPVGRYDLVFCLGPARR